MSTVMSTVRNDYYALYKGKEFRLISLGNHIPWAKYKGLTFPVFGTDKEFVAIATEDKSIADNYNFEAGDKFYWEKWVRRDELEKIWEEKVSLDVSRW